MIDILLNREELEMAYNHAEKIVEHYDNKHGKGGSGSYSHNKISSNLLGTKGEVATSKWLRERLGGLVVMEHFWEFEDQNEPGDLQVMGTTLRRSAPLEVKGVRPEHWDRGLRRMIPPNQLRHYCYQGSIAIWVTTSKDRDDGVVTIRGWNWAQEVNDLGKEVRTICDNIWLEEDALMRSPESLLLELLQTLT